MQSIDSRRQRKQPERTREYSISINKSQLWLITLLLVSPIPSDQTVIKRTNESKNKTIDTKTIDEHREDAHVPYEDIHFPTYIDFNNETKNESYLHIAKYSQTNKEKESDLNSTESVNGTVVSSEDKNSVIGRISKDDTVIEEIAKSELDQSQQKSKDHVQINDNLKHSIETDDFVNEGISKTLDTFKQERGKERESRVKVEQRDIIDAIDHGMRALEELVQVKEPLLYRLGLFLDDNDPASKVANFGAPTSRKAILVSRIGYATLEASKKIAETFHKNVGRQSAGIPSEFHSRIELDECPLRGRPRCPPASRRFRTADGTCNNLEHPWRGSAMLPMQRFLPPVYEDGIQSIRRSVSGIPLPSPREISTVIHRDKNQEIQSVTLMFMQWGQFVDHDVTSTVKSRSFNGSIPRCCEGGGRRMLPPELLHPSCLPIEVPRTDLFLRRFGIGCMEFIRSAPSTRIDCELGWREQINQVTPYVDASTIYGSDIETSDSIRTFRNGQIFYGRPGQGPLNPPDPPGGELCRAGALSEECLQPGDGRVSENPGLVAMHTIFVRYHNKIASVLSKINVHWSDERVFQETRRIVYSVIQHITYREYLPIVLGPEVMDLFELRLLKKGYYDKYDTRVNPAIANSFSTAAFRFGHSMVQNSFIRTDSHHSPLPNNVPLHKEISNFENTWSFGSIDRFLLGLSNQPSQKRDEFISDELTNHLFQFSDATPFGMDLASINIQRGRDHGIPPYTAWRQPCGLFPIKDWKDLEQVMSISSAIRLRSLFDHVDDVDLFTAGLAEKPMRGAVVGATFACIIAQQFSNLRKGDRFWYENEAFESSFSPIQLQQIRKVSLAQIMCQTMDEIETVQPFVFLSADNLRNLRVSCDSPEIRNFDLGAWTEKSFEFNSLSDNIDSFEAERSQKDFSDLKRLGRGYNDNKTKSTNEQISNVKHDVTLDLYKTDDLFTVPEHRHDQSRTHTVRLETARLLTDDLTDAINSTGQQLTNYDVYRLKRDTNSAIIKNTKNTTHRPRSSTKRNPNKKVPNTKATTMKPNLINSTASTELKLISYSNIPKKPTFSGYSPTRPTKHKPNHYEIQDNHDDVTYLFGLVPERSPKPPSNLPLQVNINIHYPQQSTTATPTTSISKNKRPNFITRPGPISNDYVTTKPTLPNIHRPTHTYEQNDFIVITKRPATSTRRPSVTSTKPAVVSYPIFVYSPAYDRPNDQNVPTKKPTYFFDNIEYATSNGHKRPNNNGLGHIDNFVRPRPTLGYHSNSDADKHDHTSYRPTTEYYINHHENDDFNDNNDKETIYISTPSNQNVHVSYRPTIFENRPFSSSNRPTYANTNNYADRHTTKRPSYSSYYFDNDSDTVIVSGIKRPQQTNTYNRDENISTDDILNEFFQRHREQLQSTNRNSGDLIDESTSRTNINDKLDFKTRIAPKRSYNKDGDQFVQISAVKKEEEFGREGEDVIEERHSKEKLYEKARRSIEKNMIIDVPSKSSSERKLMNSTEETTPYVEIPELPVNVPCSYEVPKPMIEYLPTAESFNNTKSR